MIFIQSNRTRATYLRGGTAASLFAALAGSWPSFLLIVAVLLGASATTGEIRFPRRQSHS